MKSTCIYTKRNKFPGEYISTCVNPCFKSINPTQYTTVRRKSRNYVMTY